MSIKLADSGVDYRVPFPWFGSKAAIAEKVWERLGNPDSYVEPFFGSGAVLLSRPSQPKIEIANDNNAFIVNFFRALKRDPERLIVQSNEPPFESELHARHFWLLTQEEDMRKRIEGDVDYYRIDVAAWWLWGICNWNNAGFCSGNGGWTVKCDMIVKADGDDKPRFSRSRIHSAETMGMMGYGFDDRLLYAVALSSRLSKTRVMCRDWKEVLVPACTTYHGTCAVFLDPPYSHNVRSVGLYKDRDDIAAEVRDWALSHAEVPNLRIALCGFEGEHDMPDDWDCVEWSSVCGYGRSNLGKERIWFSPQCQRRIRKLWNAESL